VPKLAFPKYSYASAKSFFNILPSLLAIRPPGITNGITFLSKARLIAPIRIAIGALSTQIRPFVLIAFKAVFHAIEFSIQSFR